MTITSQVRELQTEKEKTHQVMLSYRRDEIEDLIQTVNKRLEANAEKRAGAEAPKKDSSEAELLVKRDRLQDELNAIEEQLFELEKKYGEVPARRRKKNVVVEEAAGEADEEAIKDEEQVKETENQPAQEEEREDSPKEKDDEVAEEAEPPLDFDVSSFSEAALKVLVEEYDKKVSELDS